MIPNQQYPSTEGKSIAFHILAHSNLTRWSSNPAQSIYYLSRQKLDIPQDVQLAHAPQTAVQSSLSLSAPNTQTPCPTEPDLWSVSTVLTINRNVLYAFTTILQWRCCPGDKSLLPASKKLLCPTSYSTSEVTTIWHCINLIIIIIIIIMSDLWKNRLIKQKQKVAVVIISV